MKWSKITPTLIGSDYNRYEITSSSEGLLHVLVKRPSKGMSQCDRCPGPHSKKNLPCSQNRDREAYIEGPGHDMAGIYLYELYTMQQLPGRWEIEEDKHTGLAGTARLIQFF